ncbi:MULTISPECIES: hypothetical protein [Candidatus Nitrosocaldus]|jgi:hypothetical protein|uniref:Uncharacterized protein n=1 Tax=Candidatus Nitrosocaldus cavascurensis TaxID=2058097 RepID=A0A2K5APT0_9ARCH|nr:MULTISPECIES: hypothetical protein [Candidatus Nitrosocaldus]GBC74042.1 hypothetical protein HRbin05_00073 [archaeon HR05]SPC33653.1 membrane protein of unknown function [Candidatus Nitrosocaldus cavascurensis]
MVFGLSAGLLTVIAVFAVIALIALSIGIVNTIGNTFTDIALTLPKFNYDDDNNSGSNLTMYTFFRDSSLYIIAIVLILAGISLVFENLAILPRHTAYSMISRSAILIIMLFAFPLFWDPIAYSIEEFSLYILSQEDPSRADEKIKWLWENISAIAAPSMPDPMDLLDPAKLSEHLFVDVFMGAFKSFIALMLMMSLYLIGTIRLVLTAVLIIGLPLILMISLIPFLKRISDMLINTLIGLSIAPILSSLTVAAGSAYVMGADLEPLQLWIASVAIASLAVYFPALLAPAIGSLITTISAWVTGAGVSGILFAGGSIAGAARGAVAGIGTIASGLESTLGRTPTALELARAAMSTPAVKTIGKSAAAGFGAGMLGGLLASIRPATEALSIPSISRFTDNAVKSTFITASNEGREYGMEMVRNFAGSLIEGAIAYYASIKPNASVDGREVNRWFYTVKRLYEDGDYNALTRFANEYFMLPDNILHGREEVFGRVFGEYIMHIGKDKRPLTNLYYWLEQIRERGGISRVADPRLLKEIISNRDANREKVESMYNIRLPNPNFEVIDLTVWVDDVSDDAHKDDKNG